mgnify:CR=1 FL=1
MVTPSLINTLSGMLLLTSLLVIETKKPRRSAGLFCIRTAADTRGRSALGNAVQVLVAAEDASGAMYEPKGIDPDELLQHATANKGFIGGYAKAVVVERKIRTPEPAHWCTGTKMILSMPDWFTVTMRGICPVAYCVLGSFML